MFLSKMLSKHCRNFIKQEVQAAFMYIQLKYVSKIVNLTQL